MTEAQVSKVGLYVLSTGKSRLVAGFDAPDPGEAGLRCDPAPAIQHSAALFASGLHELQTARAKAMFLLRSGAGNVRLF